MISAGVIYHNNKYLLVCRNTVVNGAGDWKYDLPKGINDDPHEEWIDTAVREFYEETNIKLKKNNAKYEGIYPYNKQKSLYLISYYTDTLFADIVNYKCNSMIEKDGEIIKDQYGNPYPEVDDYKIIKFNIIEKYLRANMVRVLKPILHEINRTAYMYSRNRPVFILKKNKEVVE